MSGLVSKDIPFLQSDDKIRSVLCESNKYLDTHGNEQVWKIFTALRVFNDVTDLIPFTIERMGTGYLLPKSETQTALDNSIQFCKMGFYKQSFSELRNVLELGILSIYWELDDDGHIKIQDWLHSRERTPRIKKILPRLTENPNIKTFDDKHNFCNTIGDLYDKLSGFVHTRGIKHSHWGLSRSNVNRFNQKSLLRHLDLLLEVINVIVIACVLKYPLSLQHTPLYQKFGLNYPIGLCLDVDQSTALREFLDKDILRTLQTISDSDVEAVGIAQQINDRPDLSQEQRKQQMDEFDKAHTGGQ